MSVMETCAICLEKTIRHKPLFYCNHVFFHNNCIRSCKKCPLCRSTRKTTEKRILVWHEYQRKSAELYRKMNQLKMDVVVIDSLREKRPGDIFYHYG